MGPTVLTKCVAHILLAHIILTMYVICQHQMYFLNYCCFVFTVCQLKVCFLMMYVSAYKQ